MKRITNNLNKDIFGITILEFLILFLGNLSMVIGTNMFLISSDLYPTGLVGLATEFSQILENTTSIVIPYNIIFLILNIPIIILGYYKVGKKFINKTLISLLFFTILAQIVPTMTLISSVTTGDKLLPAIVGAILTGFGVGVLLKEGASSGGIDVVAVYMSIYKNKSFGLYNLIINSFVIVIAVILSRDIAIGALSLINLYIANTVIDRIHNSQEKRFLIIFTNHEKEVTKVLYENVFRGITIFESTGGYSRQPNNTLMISISHGEIYHAITVVKEVDQQAFITVLKADNVIGNFQNAYQKTL